MEGFGKRAAKHIRRVNDAPDARAALNQTFAWLQSELAGVARQRADDADALRWELVEMLAQWASGIPDRCPDARFTGLHGIRPQLQVDALVALAREGGGRE